MVSIKDIRDELEEMLRNGVLTSDEYKRLKRIFNLEKQEAVAYAFCKECGKRIPTESVYCPYCGDRQKTV